MASCSPGFRAIPFLGDAASFAGSAALLGKALPDGEPARPSATTLLDDVRASLRWSVTQPVLRVLALVVGTFAFCQAMVVSVLVLYGVRVLGLTKSQYGLFLAVGAIGDVVGSILAHRVHARLGAAWTIGAAGIAAAAGYVVLASTSTIGVAVAGCTLEAFAVALGNVATLSLRHEIIPTELFGRVTTRSAPASTGSCRSARWPEGSSRGGRTSGPRSSSPASRRSSARPSSCGASAPG